jgi:hypothetical protein
MTSGVPDRHRRAVFPTFEFKESGLAQLYGLVF